MTEQQPQPESQPQPQAPTQPHAGAPSAPPPPPRAPYKRLVRSRSESPISGVCGGVAQYLGVDATVVRVLAVVAALVTFPAGPIVYAVMWAVMPQE